MAPSGSNRVPLFVLVAVLSAAGGYAFLSGGRSSPPKPAPDAPRSPPQAPQAQLPPNHPPVGGSADPHGAIGRVRPPTDEQPAITWKMPDGWAAVENPSRMRIATYKPPRAAGDTEDAELSVSRAGGTTEANVHRWIGQFDEAGPDERSERNVRGLKIVTVEVNGTYLGGMMGGGGPAAKHPKWALLGAVVETPGSFYFFKMVGPVATVRAARKAFDAMLSGIEPKPQSL